MGKKQRSENLSADACRRGFTEYPTTALSPFQMVQRKISGDQVKALVIQTVNAVTFLSHHIGMWLFFLLLFNFQALVLI